MFTSDPARSYRLRDAVVAAVAASPSPDLDVSAVAGVALMTVARLAMRETTRDDAHAVALAVRLARQTVATAAAAVAAGTVSLDDESDAVRTRVATWSGGCDPASVVVGSPETRAAAAVAALPGNVVRSWQGIAAAWLAHDPASCERCQTPGTRPGRLTLAGIRAHAAGHGPKTPDARRMTRHDAAVVARVSDAVAPVLSVPPSSVPAWLAAMVTRGPGSFARAAGNDDARTVTRYVSPVATVARDVSSSVRLAGPVVPVPADRRAASRARREAAAAAAAMRHGETVARRREAATYGTPGSVVARDAGGAVPDPWGRSVPVYGGSSVVLPVPGLPLWTHGPVAPAPDPANVPDAPETGRMIGERVTVTRRMVATVPAAGPVARVTGERLPVTTGTPDTDTVTVTRPDGVVTRRAMTDAERDALAPVRETATVDYVTPDGEVTSETVPVVRGAYAGEGTGYGETGRDGTAPAPASDRVAGEPDAPVRSFAVAPSPRKRPGSNTGPTIPVRLR
jgi:hypothetical protein